MSHYFVSPVGKDSPDRRMRLVLGLMASIIVSSSRAAPEERFEHKLCHFNDPPISDALSLADHETKAIDHLAANFLDHE